MLPSGLKRLTFCVVRVLNVSMKLPTFALNEQAVLVHPTSRCVMPSEQNVRMVIRLVNQFMSKWLELELVVCKCMLITKRVNKVASVTSYGILTLDSFTSNKIPVDRVCSIPKWKCRLRAVYYDCGDRGNYGDSVNQDPVLDFDCDLWSGDWTI